MPEQGRSPGEVLKAFLKPNRAQGVIAVVLCLVSMAAVWQMRANREDQAYSSLRRDELIALLDQLNTNNNELRREIDEQSEQRRQLRSGAASERLAQEQARKRIQELAILGGTAPAQGPGITIRITDPKKAVTAQLLLDAVEEMRDAGAEVMELNGVRIVASSSFGGDPGEITVDGSPIRAPYVLKVIGEPHALAEGARFRGGLVSQAQAPEVGADVTITPSDLLIITALHTPVDPRYAKPA